MNTTLLLTILNWVVMLLLWSSFARKMKEAKELEISASDPANPKSLEKNRRAHLKIGLGILAIVFGLLGAIAQKYINNL